MRYESRFKKSSPKHYTGISFPQEKKKKPMMTFAKVCNKQAWYLMFGEYAGGGMSVALQRFIKTICYNVAAPAIWILHVATL